MKKIKIILVLTALALLAAGCNSVSPQPAAEAAPQSPDQNTYDPGFTDPQPPTNPNYRGVQQSETQKLNNSLNQMKASQP
jgi:PBP1b-binding outer membrane lipoprotein LpoB